MRKKKFKEKSSSNYEIILNNNLGKIVSHYLVEENLGQQALNIEGFKPGIYYLILTCENMYYSSKFIIVE